MKSQIAPIILLFIFVHLTLPKEGPFTSTLDHSRDLIVTDSSVKIVPGYSQIKSIKQLLEGFKGKPVFIDLWATWCEPCLQEFKYSNILHGWLEIRQIAMVYISFDKDEQDILWRKTISEFKLSGNHIRANQTLQDALTTLIWGGKDAYSIPHYLLFDGNGRLVDKNLSAPSNGSVLQNEIESTLFLK